MDMNEMHIARYDVLLYDLHIILHVIFGCFPITGETCEELRLHEDGPVLSVEGRTLSV